MSKDFMFKTLVTFADGPLKNKHTRMLIDTWLNDKKYPGFKTLIFKIRGEIGYYRCISGDIRTMHVYTSPTKRVPALCLYWVPSTEYRNHNE